MAKARRKKGGRVTPSKAAAPAPRRARRRRLGPNAPIEGPVQPGRRPSRAGFLLAVALVWIMCGVIALTSLSASWKLIPGIAFIGIGVLFLRGAAATLARRGDA